VIVGAGVYRHGKRVDVTGTFEELADSCTTPDSFTWLGLYEPSDDELGRAAEAFGIHPLAIEDAKLHDERPKVDVFGDTLTVVLRPARYDDASESVQFGQITMMCSPRHIVVVRHGDAVPLNTLRSRLEAMPERLALGPGAVLHEILDRVVEGYYPVLTGLGDDIDQVEGEVFSDSIRIDPTQRIYELQREVLQFSRAVTPLAEMLAELRFLSHPVLNEELQHYVSDTNDDVKRVMDQINGDRELLHSALEANLTQVSIRQNSDMRKMSAWVAILAVPTMIAGIYGMNFEHMPELETRYGYFFVVGSIAAICLFLYTRFRKSGWL
jgi:magnesium transporter